MVRWSTKVTRLSRDSSAGNCGGGTEVMQAASTGLEQWGINKEEAGNGWMEKRSQYHSGIYPSGMVTVPGMMARKVGCGQTLTATCIWITSANIVSNKCILRWYDIYMEYFFRTKGVRSPRATSKLHNDSTKFQCWRQRRLLLRWGASSSRANNKDMFRYWLL